MKKKIITIFAMFQIFVFENASADKPKEKGKPKKILKIDEEEGKEYKKNTKVEKKKGNKGNSENAKENWGQLKDELDPQSKEEEKRYKERVKEDRKKWQGDDDTEKDSVEIKPYGGGEEKVNGTLGIES